MEMKRNISRVKVYVAQYAHSNRGKFMLLDDYYTDDYEKIPEMGSLVRIDDNYCSDHQVLCRVIEYEFDKLNGIIPVYNILIGCEDNGEELKLVYDCSMSAVPFEELLTDEVWVLLNLKRLNRKD